jgi:hypothetical protein
LLQERGFAWVSNAFDDDVPYDDPAHPGLSVPPYALDINAMKFFHLNGFVRASEMVAYVNDALDVLLAEARQGKPRLLHIGYHLRIAGRPARCPAFEKVRAQLTEFGDQIWVARRMDIAKAWRDRA